MPTPTTLQLHLGEHFTIERELVGGGMSRVFVAYDRRLDRRVAIKVLRPELAAGVSLERFHREIRTAASLQHPLIVPVLDTGEVEGLPYFTMPFVEGESLRTRLSRGPMSAVDTVRVLRDVARALAVAHSRGVVHRDIKPDNVLLANEAAVVADFGVAKAVADARRAEGAQRPLPSHTTEGFSLGTPAYMAPEQVAADPAASYPVDLYALGVVAYEMLTGAPPFADRPPQQVMAAHIAEMPEPVQARRADVPQALASLVMQCLQKDPAARPASAAALVTALEDPQVVSGSFLPIAGSASEVARQLTDGHRAPGRRLLSRRGARAGLAAVGAALLALVVWMAGGRDRSGAAGSGGVTAAVPVPPVEALPRSVAVLPFAYVGGDTAQGYVARAITEAITSGLSQERGLRVQSQAASAALQQRLAAGDTTGLPVRTLVEGVVEVQDEQVRLTVRLVDARDGFTLFADRVDGRRDALFALEDDVATAMRELLRAHFQLDSAGADTPASGTPASGTPASANRSSPGS